MAGTTILLSHALHHKKTIFVAHFLGTLATNAAYTIVASDVIKACQPFFTIFHILISPSLQVIAFQMMHTSLFNIWSAFAAAISCIAFTGRNVSLKDENKKWGSALEKFVVVTSLSATWSFLLLCVQAAANRTVVFTSLHLGMGSTLLLALHPTYSLASFQVLEMVTPVTHALVTICIRLLLVVENGASLIPVTLNWNQVLSASVIIVGLYLYYYCDNQQFRHKWLVFKLVLLFSITAYLALSTTHTIHKVDQSSHNRVEFSIVTMSRHQTNEKSISTAWLYDRSISDDAVDNIKYIADSNPAFKVYVYCGTAQCIQEICKLEKENVVVGYAVVSDIVKGTPLEKWVVRHPINKLLAGREFENHLHQVTILGILWQYGGFYVSPMVRMDNGSLPECRNTTCALGTGIVTVPREGLPAVLHFTKKHPIISRLAEVFVNKYPAVDGHSPFEFDFMNMVWKTECNITSCIDQIFYGGHKETFMPSENLDHYGVLSSSAVGHFNDEMENIAGLQYLPFVDTIIRSNELELLNRRENITAVFSRFSLESRVYLNLDSGNLDERLTYPQEPIDTDTQNFLQANGVKVYSPSSLMLLMKNPDLGVHERHHIYLTDVKSEHQRLLPLNIRKVAVSLYKYEINDADYNRFTASKVCYRLMERFGSARLVITANFQHALSCVAMETPVIYISTSGGNPNPLEFPVPGVLGSLVHMVGMHRTNRTKAKKWFHNFSWGNIPHNPNPAVLMRLRANSWNIIRRNQHLYDTAVRFGVVPMSPPLSLQHVNKLTFYLVFSTSNKNSLKVLKTGKRQSGQFNWRHWRSIESIFYHHPTAQVKVYSNTLPLSTFDVLTEAGYSIQVQRYHLEELLKGTPAIGFVKKLTEARKGPHWYSNVSDLLRLLLLYRWGGIYMDTDVVVLKPLHSLQTNVLGWETKDKRVMNGAFAKFEKGNLFLEACLKEYARNYNGKNWGENGPQLLTRMYRASKWSSDVISLVDYRQFYMIHWSRMTWECFGATEGETFDSNMKTLRTTAFVLHTNSKMSGNYGIAGNKMKSGTICNHVLNAFCVICDQN